MVLVLSGPPTSAGGTLLSEMIGVEFGDERQALVRRQIASSQALFRPAAIFRCSLKLTSPKWHQLEPTAVGARGRRGPKGPGLDVLPQRDSGTRFWYRPRPAIPVVPLAADKETPERYVVSGLSPLLPTNSRIRVRYGDIPEGVGRVCPHFQLPS